MSFYTPKGNYPNISLRQWANIMSRVLYSIAGKQDHEDGSLFARAWAQHMKAHPHIAFSLVEKDQEIDQALIAHIVYAYDHRNDSISFGFTSILHPVSKPIMDTNERAALVSEIFPIFKADLVNIERGVLNPENALKASVIFGLWAQGESFRAAKSGENDVPNQEWLDIAGAYTQNLIDKDQILPHKFHRDYPLQFPYRPR